jgi:hypothetical protein
MNTAPLVSGSESARKYPAALPENQKFLLGLPCYGSLMTQPFAASLIQTLLQTPFIGKIEFELNDSLVSRARNSIVARFLASDYQWLLFLDNDLEFQPEHIARLWLHATKEERRIVCGLYALKKISPQFVFNALPGQVPDKNGAVKVSESGTGCMVIHRSVFETMREKMPEIAFTTDQGATAGAGGTQWDFFAVGPYKYPSGLVRYLSEDWMFCQRARDLGIDVWADTQIQIRHMGNLVYPPAVAEVVTALRTIRAMGHPHCPPEKI